MDKETRKNPKSWGFSEQEMNFADNYVFLYFHSSAVYDGMAVYAAKAAGYVVPVDVCKADDLGKSLVTKTKKYIDAEIERFKAILSGEQRRNLWEYISDFVAGTPEQGVCNNDYGSITNH